MIDRIQFGLRRLVRTAALVIGLTATGMVQAEVQVFMKVLNGLSPWNGNSTAEGRKGWTELKSLSFSAENSTTFASGSGGSASIGKTAFGKIVLNKPVDQITPALFSNLTAGLVLDAKQTEGDVIFEFVQGDPNGKPFVFFKLELRTVYVVSMQTNVSEGDETLEETVELVCGAIRQTFTPMQADGSAGTAIVKSWSVVAASDKF